MRPAGRLAVSRKIVIFGILSCWKKQRPSNGSGVCMEISSIFRAPVVCPADAETVKQGKAELGTGTLSECRAARHAQICAETIFQRERIRVSRKLTVHCDTSADLPTAASRNWSAIESGFRVLLSAQSLSANARARSTHSPGSSCAKAWSRNSVSGSAESCSLDSNGAIYLWLIHVDIWLKPT